MVDRDVAARPAVAADAAAVAALQVRSWQAAYRGLVPDHLLDGLADDAWLGRWTDQLTGPPTAGVHRLVSTDVPEGVPRAVAVGGPVRDPTPGVTGELYLLYADPVVWGRGHGAALLRAVERRLDADGHERALLWVAAGNERSIGFYRHHGWEPDGTTRRDELAGATFDELRMVRDLP